MAKPESRGRLRLGYIVIGFLFIVKVVEYVVGTNVQHGAWPFLALLAIISSWPIVYYFMHIAQLRRRGE